MTPSSLPANRPSHDAQTAQAMIAKHIDCFPLLKLDQVIDWQTIEQYPAIELTVIKSSSTVKKPVRQPAVGRPLLPCAYPLLSMTLETTVLLGQLPAYTPWMSMNSNTLCITRRSRFRNLSFHRRTSDKEIMLPPDQPLCAVSVKLRSPISSAFGMPQRHQLSRERRHLPINRRFN
ncbi:hypothetical protein ACVWQG_10160 [Neisseria meningitidis]